jgi:hypothetical protein
MRALDLTTTLDGSHLRIGDFFSTNQVHVGDGY